MKTIGIDVLDYTIRYARELCASGIVWDGIAKL
jgi:hypothetical protein